MSLKSWKEEFYPTPASDFDRDSNPVEIVRHSLNKWRGLLPENMSYHDVKYNIVNNIVDSNTREEFGIDTASCSLCQVFKGCGACIDCPLYKVRSGIRCDEPRAGKDNGPFDRHTRTGDPKPMIEWLGKTLELVENPPKKEPTKVELLIEQIAERICHKPEVVKPQLVRWNDDAGEPIIGVTPGIIFASTTYSSVMFQHLVDLSEELRATREGNHGP